MKLGVVVSNDPWRYFEEVYAAWQERYAVTLFQHNRIRTPVFNNRLNRYRFRRNLQAFLEGQDVVFFEWASDLLVAATRLPKTTRIVTRLHRYEMFQWAEKVDWSKVDRVILVSEAMKSKFAERFPEYAGKAVVVNEGVDTRKFQPVDRSFSGELGTLCYLGPRKRVYELILAFAEMAPRQAGLRLNIGGSGNKHSDYNDALTSLVRKLGLGDRIRFQGDIAEPWTWYPNIDIFISNSYSEGLQVAPMEAMACGRYTLSHAWDGAEELVPAEQLFLTNTELVEKVMAYASLTASEQRRKQEEMRAIACEKFDMHSKIENLTAAVEEMARTPEVVG